MSGLKISHDPLHRNAAQVPAVSVSARAGAPERDDSCEGATLPIGISVVLDAGEAAHNETRDEFPRPRLAGVDERTEAQLDLDVLPRAIGQLHARHGLQLQAHRATFHGVIS